MKCETHPGDRKCRNCLRRNTECISKRVVMPEVVDDRMPSQAVLSYESADPSTSLICHSNNQS